MPGSTVAVHLSGAGTMSTMAPEDLTPASAGTGPRWTVVLPVKGGPDAKSRLRHPARARLARAFALDATAAVLACPTVAAVVVVTADDAVAADHAALGARVVADPGTGLAAALAAGTAAAAPDAPCALLLADLPALRPAELGRTLATAAAVLAARAAQAVVPDADGTGTVMLAAARPAALRPRFGPGSAAAHARDAVVLPDAPAGLRRDVDTDAHLAAAVVLGVGPRTAAALATAAV